jgi:hypothetical protein
MTAQLELVKPAEPAPICETEGHEYNFGICVDCDHTDEDYDPTPQGEELVTDRVDMSSYAGLKAAA